MLKIYVLTTAHQWPAERGHAIKVLVQLAIEQLIVSKDVLMRAYAPYWLNVRLARGQSPMFGGWNSMDVPPDAV